MSAKKMRLELLVASPPTKKCRFLISTFESFVESNSRLRLDIYYAGSAIPVPTTAGYKKTLDKRIRLPMVFVNGTPIPKEFHLDKDKLFSFVEKEFSIGEDNWHV